MRLRTAAAIATSVVCASSVWVSTIAWMWWSRLRGRGRDRVAEHGVGPERHHHRRFGMAFTDGGVIVRARRARVE